MFKKKNNNYNYPIDIETGLNPSSPNEYYLICQIYLMY